MGPDSPITAVAAALHAARLRDFPTIIYMDRDWERHRAWFGALTSEQRARIHDMERRSGESQGPKVELRRRPTEQECRVTAFPQLWGSTALGYGGIGGSAMTTAYTVVVESAVVGLRAVYFGEAGRLAYLVPIGGAHEETFRQAVAAQSLPSVRDAAALGWQATGRSDAPGRLELTGEQVRQLAQFAGFDAAGPAGVALYVVESRDDGAGGVGVFVSKEGQPADSGLRLDGRAKARPETE